VNLRLVHAAQISLTLVGFFIFFQAFFDEALLYEILFI